MGQQERVFDHQVFAAGLTKDLQWAAPNVDSSAASANGLSLVPASCVEIARRLQAQRQKRLSYFSNKSMFADASWDVLLCLFIGEAEARPASLDTLSRSANCSHSTTLRWVNVLAEEGLVTMVNYSEQLPEIGVVLSAKGHAIMSQYLADVSTD